VPGPAVERGHRFLTIEAIKMETAVYAELEGEVEEVVSPAGTRVEAYDLVLTLTPEG
jgi:pyruvate carboxylase